MSDHAFLPSGYTSSSGDQKDSCLRCGKTRRAHALILSWNEREYVFESIEAAKAAGFYV